VTGDSSRAAWLQQARSHLRSADPVLARLIDAGPAFDPRAWLAQLPPMDLYGALLFQVTGQQLSVPATRRTLGRIEDLFGDHLPSPTELLAVDPGTLREAGLSWRKISTLRDLAERLSDGRLDQDALSSLPDDQLIAELTTIPGIGPWTVQGAMLIALGREDVALPGDLALRKAVQAAYQLDPGGAGRRHRRAHQRRCRTRQGRRSPARAHRAGRGDQTVRPYRQDGSQLSPARQGRQAPRAPQFDLRTGLTCVPVPLQVHPGLNPGAPICKEQAMTQTATQQPAPPPPDLVTVADVMQPPLTTADTNDHVAAAAYLMKHARATALTVLDTQTGQPKGILTKADIAHAVADGKDLNDLRIRELMTTRPAVITPATSIRDAAQIMTRGHFRHLPVCGDSGLAGIIDIADICRALIDSDVSRRPADDTAVDPDGLTPATNEPPPELTATQSCQ
jgi:DNA-3-methyladenine glycosylase II